MYIFELLYYALVIFEEIEFMFTFNIIKKGFVILGLSLYGLYWLQNGYLFSFVHVKFIGISSGGDISNTFNVQLGLVS